jgi:hypothetical protein
MEADRDDTATNDELVSALRVPRRQKIHAKQIWSWEYCSTGDRTCFSIEAYI